MSKLTVLTLSSNEFFIFFIADSGAIYANHWFADQEITWNSVNGNPYPITAGGLAASNGSIVAVARTNNEIQVFFSGSDGAVWTTYCYLQKDKDIWQENAFPITNSNILAPNSAITAVANESGITHVFFVGKDGALWVNHRAPAYPNWLNENFCLIKNETIIADSLSIVTRKKNEIDVFFTDENGILWTLWKKYDQKIREAKIFPLTDIKHKAKIGTQLLTYVAPDDQENLYMIFMDNNNVLWTTCRTDINKTTTSFLANAASICDMANLIAYDCRESIVYLFYHDSNANVKVFLQNRANTKYKVSLFVENNTIDSLAYHCVNITASNSNFFWLSKDKNIYLKRLIETTEQNNVIATSKFDYALNLHPLGLLQDKLTSSWNKMLKSQANSKFFNKALYYPPHITLSYGISGKDIIDQSFFISQLRNVFSKINQNNLAVTNISLEKYASDDCPYLKIEAQDLIKHLYESLKTIVPNMYNLDYIKNHPLHITLVYPAENDLLINKALIEQHKKIIVDEFAQTNWQETLTKTNWKISLWWNNRFVQEEIISFELSNNKFKERDEQTYYYSSHTRFNFLRSNICPKEEISTDQSDAEQQKVQYKV